MTSAEQKVRTWGEFERYLMEFFTEIRGSEQSSHTLKPQTDLFAAGLLDSLRMVELVASLEERLQVEIPLELLSVRSFRTPELMWSKIVSHLIDAEVRR